MHPHRIGSERTHPGRTQVRLDTSLELLLAEACAVGPRVLATVVATAGSTYRKPGARMLIMADGSHLGLLTGGCLESDLALHARQVMDSGAARAVEYDMRGPDDELFGIGAGCVGAMRVLLEPAGATTRAAAALSAAGRALRSTPSTALMVVHESRELTLGTYHPSEELPPRLAAAAGQAMTGAVSRNIDWQSDAGGERAFVEFLARAPHLLICGAGPDAEPVAASARSLGWRVTVVDHRPAYALAARFPGASVHLADAGALRSTVALESCHAAVVMSHQLRSDESYLRELAAAGAPQYIGLLGPAARRERLIQELGSAADSLRTRVRGPVGIQIGAATPEAIALSIVSQVHAHLAGLE
jgi:xanthine/CO dehydrogenase XdhC/CoxF family maturation factor